MATDGVSALGGAGGLGQNDFLKLLVTQLQNQNPLEPVSDTQFISQLAQFSSLQGIQTLNASFDQTLKLQQLTGGADLIGRTVQFTTNGTAGTGKVSGLQVQNGSVLLQVGGKSVPLDSVGGVIPS